MGSAIASPTFLPRVVIGALAIALGLSLSGSTIHHLVRREKGRDPVASLLGLFPSQRRRDGGRDLARDHPA